MRFPRAWRAMACLVSLVGMFMGCTEEAGGLYLSVTAEPGVDAATSLVMRALVEDEGSDLRFEQAFSIAGRDLQDEAYVIEVEAGGFTAGTETLVSLVAVGGGVAVASYTGHQVVSATEVVDVVLKAIDSGCDADGDGYKACEQKPECCSDEEKADAADCDDGDADANPFADTKACRICSAECGEADGDGFAEVVESGSDASDVEDVKDANVADTELVGEIFEVVDTLVELDGADADLADADVSEVCTADCDGKVCGPDGCGGSCGTCAGATLCEQGACVCPAECAPEGKKECTDDTHYRTCGDLNSDDCLEWTTSACTGGDTCHGEGICDCAPSCAGKECGDNGCGGSCGGCANGKTCDAGECVCGGNTDDECDNVDDDCDGQTDEGYGVHATACGVGACKATGTRTCVEGVETDTCAPGLPAADDASCNNEDDDCDGATDEDYPGVTTTCGKGACAAMGKMSCAGGVESNSCVAGTAGAETATCDGIDNDCDGQTDEGYVSDATCGVGYCKTHNTPSSCSAGVVTACTPSAKLSATDATCDGVDDDCDGVNDENALCDDGNKCNGISTCVSGSCQQTTLPVTCAAQDACHVAGSCNAATGVCTNPEKCTGGTTCVGGTCCACTSGACCDGCNYKTSSVRCNNHVSFEYYCKDGTICGDEVWGRVREQYCSGSSSACDGALLWSTGSFVKKCASTEACSGSPNAVCSTNAACSTVTAGFVKLNAGSFWMGSPEGQACLSGYTGGGCPGSGTAESEPGRSSSETLHYVELTTAFEMQAKEVTQGEWQSVFPGWNPSYFPNCGETCPVEQVSWYDVVAYANAKSSAAGLTACYVLTGIACEDGTSVASPADCMTSARGGINVATVALNGVASPYHCTGFRLPTESEWEYAYRAGGLTAFHTSAGNNGAITQTDREPLDPNLDQIGWYGGNSTATYGGAYGCSSWFDGATTCGPQPGGGKEANAWGLYDMSGNVWEWCWDWYASTYPAGTVVSPVQDPSGSGSGSIRVYRGGSWGSYAGGARGALRNYFTPGYRYNNFGFRLARSVP